MNDIEIHRTRKGRVLFDADRSVYEVWLRRDDGRDELVLETRSRDVAMAFLRDYRLPGRGI